MKSVRRFAIAVALCVLAGVAGSQESGVRSQNDKPPMPLAVAWQNVVAACKAAQLDVLTGRQGVAVDESLRRLAPVLAAYDLYAVDIEKLILGKRGSAIVNSEVVSSEVAIPKAEAE